MNHYNQKNNSKHFQVTFLHSNNVENCSFKKFQIQKRKKGSFYILYLFVFIILNQTSIKTKKVVPTEYFQIFTNIKNTKNHTL